MKAKRLIALFAFMLLAGSLFTSTLPAVAQTNPYPWEPSVVPRALVFEGFWSDYFKIESALHTAGLPYTRYSMTDLPDKFTSLNQNSVIVIANGAASRLPQEQIKEFVANGGGLVVLGGFWAFNCGRYNREFYSSATNGLIVDTLPVMFTTNLDVPGSSTGWPLTRAASATWLTAFDAAAKPLVFFMHDLQPKSEAVVQLMAGDRPAIVSGTFGKGRVVTIALTANGEPPAGALAFWDWPEWPRVLGQAIDWAAGARPLAVPHPTDPLKPLTHDEIGDLSAGLKIPDNLAARANAHPSAEAANALFERLMAQDIKLPIGSILPALVPYAKPDWGARLSDWAGQTPNPNDRIDALVLLGATHWPGAKQQLLSALAEPKTKLAALEGLGRCGDPTAAPALVAVYETALNTARVANEPERFSPAELATGQARLATEATLALYRIGDSSGPERILAMCRRVRFYSRFYHSGVGDQNNQLIIAEERLHHHSEPIPAPALPAFIKAAQIATDPAGVDWIIGELNASLASFPPATWQPLTTAKDGIIARFARAAIGH